MHYQNFTCYFPLYYECHTGVICLAVYMNAVPNEALKYRSVTDIVRPIHKLARRREKGIGHSV